VPTSIDEYDESVRSRTPALLRSAYLLTTDQHLAEDLVRAALARTHRAWRGLRETGNAEAYTRRVMADQRGEGGSGAAEGGPDG
jgi:DNA-directed RNA polymerase specialized sigma24 family protein